MSRLLRRIHIWWLLRMRGTVHDFTRRGWGRNLEKCGNSWAMWCPGKVRDGDICKTELGEFVMFDVRPCYDPPDMYFCKFYRVEGDKHRTARVGTPVGADRLAAAEMLNRVLFDYTTEHNIEFRERDRRGRP